MLSFNHVLLIAGVELHIKMVWCLGKVVCHWSVNRFLWAKMCLQLKFTISSSRFMMKKLWADSMWQNGVMFQSSRDNVKGRHTGNSGHQSSSTAEIKVECVVEMFQQDWRITFHHVSQLGLSYNSVQRLMVYVFHYIKVCCNWSHMYYLRIRRLHYWLNQKGHN